MLQCGVCADLFPDYCTWETHRLVYHGFSARCTRIEVPVPTENAQGKKFCELVNEEHDLWFGMGMRIAIEEVMPQDFLEEWLADRKRRGWNNDGGGGQHSGERDAE